MDLEREGIQMLLNLEGRARSYDEMTGRYIKLALKALERLIIDYRNDCRVFPKSQLRFRKHIEKWFYSEDFYEFFWFINSALSLVNEEFENAHEFVKLVRKQAQNYDC